MPHLARIDLYPIKSLEGITVEKATVLATGALAHDHEYAFFDSQGGVVNGKRNARIHGLRSQICNHFQTLTLQAGETDPQSFYIEEDRNILETWLSHFYA